MAHIIIVFIFLVIGERYFCSNVDVDHITIYHGHKGSYFGYDVQVVASENVDNRRIIVGAPKDVTRIQGENSGGVMRNRTTGSLFICTVDMVENLMLCNRSYGLRDETGIVQLGGQMLGASIAIREDTVVACAPSWVYRESKNDDWAKGRCIEGKGLSKTRQMKPMGGEILIDSGGDVIIGMEIAGMSVMILPDGDKVFGAPGYRGSSGGFVIEMGESKIFYPPKNKTSRIYPNYMGYSLTSGDFYGLGKHLIVVGMPRYNETGAVGIYEHRDDRVAPRKRLLGFQIGSYYGAAVSTVDTNKDGFDDVIVGAPNYFNSQRKMEVGRVYVHINKKGRTLLFKRDSIILSGDPVHGSRFGTAITNLGDINHDGTPDIAIGAPYEQDGKGAVYIFNIDTERNSGKLIQKLSVAHSKGFGFHISKALDMDGNLYPDFAVGAYLSDEVYLFYTRNIINLHVEFSVSPSKIVPTASELNFTLCLHAEDNNKNSKELMLPINYKLILDIEKDISRLLIVTNQGKRRKLDDQLVVSSQDQNSKCKSYYVVHAETDDVRSPVKLQLRAKIANKTYDNTMPMLAESVFNDKILYLIDCGPEGRCVADLSIGLQSQPDIIIFNKTTIIDIRVSIRNLAEPAYLTMVNITFIGNVHYIRTNTIKGKNIQCRQVLKGATGHKQFTLQCSVANLLPTDKESVFDVTLDVSQMMNDERNLTVISYTFSESIEIDEHMDNNRAVRLIPVKYETSITIEGTSEPEQMTYTTGGHVNYMFMHEYNVWNNGPSSLLPTQVLFKIPFKSNSIANISYTQSVAGCTTEDEETFSRGSSGDSRDTSTMYTKMNNVELPTTTDSTSTSPELPQTTTRRALKVHRKRRSTDVNPDTSKNQKRVYVKCEETKDGCTSIVCKLKRMKSQTDAKIKIYMNISSDELPVTSPNEIVHIQTEGLVEEPSTMPHIPWNFTVDDVTFIVLYPSTPGKKSIPLYIIIVSVVCGLLVLLVALALCLRFGFFRRKKKQDVKTWKRQSGYYEHKRNSRLSSSGSRSSVKRSGGQRQSVNEQH